MATVLRLAMSCGLKTEIRDQRTLYIDGRRCQVIKTRWYENLPGCKALSLYMPRSDFADFLPYVPDGENSDSALQEHKDAWQLLKETTPSLFERQMEVLSKQLRRIIAEVDKQNLPYELIRSKRGQRKLDYSNNAATNHRRWKALCDLYRKSVAGN